MRSLSRFSGKLTRNQFTRLMMEIPPRASALVCIQTYRKNQRFILVLFHSNGNANTNLSVNRSSVCRWWNDQSAVQWHCKASGCFHRRGIQWYVQETMFDPSLGGMVYSLTFCVCCTGTIFAYGQTSSGKTFTMMGTSRTPGVIPQAVEDVFQSIKNVRMVTHVWNLLWLVSVSFHPKGSLLFQPKFPKKEFLLRVSYMEIYNETVTDLLVDSWKRKPLEVREQINVGWSFRWLDSEHYLEVWFSAFLC